MPEPVFRRPIAVSRPGVKLWSIDLAPDAGRLAAARRILSADESARADRFRREEDQARFATTRAALRELLAEATGSRAQELTFSEGPYGRPFLSGREDLSFNVSHSGALALIAIAPGRSVGVDIELMRENIDELELAAGFFLPAEYRAIAWGGTQLKTFYRIWTVKEAVLKAFGVGIASSLKDFEVRLCAGAPAIIPQPGAFTTDLAEISVEVPEVAAGYAAALALV